MPAKAFLVSYSANAEIDFYVQSNPLSSALKGHSINFGIEAERIRFQAGLFGITLPYSSKDNDIFDLEQSGYDVKLDYFKNNAGGPFIGITYSRSELAITVSHSRQFVSNNNAFREAQVKLPDYTLCIAGYGQAMQQHEDYMSWYKSSNHQSSLTGLTPEQVFTGANIVVATRRQEALEQAYLSHSENFIKAPSTVAMSSNEICINPVPEETEPEVFENLVGK